LEEYTDSERWNCFYSPEEWQEMKDGVLNLLAVLETGEIDARDACIRGLDRLYGERQKKLRVYVLLLFCVSRLLLCLFVMAIMMHDDYSYYLWVCGCGCLLVVICVGVCVWRVGCDESRQQSNDNNSPLLAYPPYSSL
jgi:hypothetical protein